MQNLVMRGLDFSKYQNMLKHFSSFKFFLKNTTKKLKKWPNKIRFG